MKATAHPTGLHEAVEAVAVGVGGDGVEVHLRDELQQQRLRRPAHRLQGVTAAQPQQLQQRVHLWRRSDFGWLCIYRSMLEVL